MESDNDELSKSELQSIAERVVGELDSGSYGEKFVFSRRQVIALAGAGLSVGALTTLGVDEATAQEAVGQVGTESAPVNVEAVDVNADRIHNNIGDSQVQTSWDGLVVPVGPGLGADAAIDPATTSAPIADACDLLDAEGAEFGTILLPPEGVADNSASITNANGKDIVGWGTEASQIEFTDLTGGGFDIQATSGFGSFCRWDGFALDGSDLTNRSGGSAISWSTKERSFNIGSVRFRNWGGGDPVIDMRSGAAHTSHWKHVDFGFSVNEGKNLHIGAGGAPPLNISHIAMGSSSQENSLIQIEGGHAVHVGQANLGGDNDGRAFLFYGDSFRLGYLNFEPVTSNGNWPAVGLASSSGEAHIGTIHLAGSANVTSCVEINGAAGAHISRPLISGGTVGTSRVEVTAAPPGANYYYGPGSDITNSAGSATGNVIPIADLSTDYGVA